ncbi:MAG: hypothetical protein ABSF45_04160 [Terriglobia bacterium]
MERRRASVVLVVLILFVPAIVYTSRSAAQNCCAPTPNEQMPTDYFTALTTKTDFTEQLYSYRGAVNYEGYTVHEESPTGGTNSCYDQDPDDYPGTGSPVVDGAYWTVMSGNTFVDELGWPPSTILTYSTDSKVTLPCGVVMDQDMLFYCTYPSGSGAQYVENYLTITIVSYERVTNCHEDMLGDYTMCETISLL